MSGAAGPGIMPCGWRGDVAQLGERLNRTQEVGGSNPLVSTRFLKPGSRVTMVRS